MTIEEVHNGIIREITEMRATLDEIISSLPPEVQEQIKKARE